MTDQEWIIGAKNISIALVGNESLHRFVYRWKDLDSCPIEKSEFPYGVMVRRVDLMDWWEINVGDKKKIHDIYGR